MIHDLQTAHPPADTFADVIVVGAGAAGIALAVELARLGKRVLLLEGGGAQPEAASQDLYRTELPGLAHRGVHEGRFRVHGGTTTQWGGQILELEEADFEPHSWIPGSGWPIRKRELAPHYTRALEIEGVSQSMLDDREVWGTLGEQPPHLDDLDLYMSRWCPEPNLARLHRRTLEDDPLIEVWLHANAVELLLKDGVAKGVRCRTLDGRETIFRADRYIFALGTLETTRFFLQPRPEGSLPWNQSGLLGRHFQDHIDSDAATLRPRSPKAFHSIFDSIFLRGYKYNPKLRLTRDAQREAQVLIAGGTVFSVSPRDEALVEVKSTAKHLLHGRFGELNRARLGSLVRHAPLVARQTIRYAVQHRSYHPADAEIRLRVHCEQEPHSASAITLSTERDCLGLLRGRLDWRISALELRSIRHFVATAKSALAPLAEVLPHPDLADDDRFLTQCQDSYHHMGGMRMDTSPTAGVVTPELRLHNTRNVYVCSGAAFPSSGFSNPTHTLLALAMRLAAHLCT